MEETSPAWLAKRAHIAKHVEYPNKDTSRVFNSNKSTHLFSLVPCNCLASSRQHLKEENRRVVFFSMPSFYSVLMLLEEHE